MSILYGPENMEGRINGGKQSKGTSLLLKGTTTDSPTAILNLSIGRNGLNVLPSEKPGPMMAGDQ